MDKIILILVFFSVKINICFSQKLTFQDCYFVDDNAKITQSRYERATDLTLSKKLLSNAIPHLQKVVFIPDSTIFEKVKVKIKTSNTSINECRFAKKILEGEIQLFVLPFSKDELGDNISLKNEELFILKKDTSYYSLTDFIIVDENRIRNESKYKGTLIYIFQDVPRLKTKIERLGYDEKSIIGLINEYNSLKGASKRSIIVSKNSKKVNHNIGLGLNYHAYTFNDGYMDVYGKSTSFSIMYKLNSPYLTPDISLLAAARITHFPKINERYIGLMESIEYRVFKYRKLSINTSIGVVIFVPFDILPVFRAGIEYRNWSINYQREMLGYKVLPSHGVALQYYFLTRAVSK